MKKYRKPFGCGIFIFEKFRYNRNMESKKACVDQQSFNRAGAFSSWLLAARKALQPTA
jgi:hypothetical protein